MVYKVTVADAQNYLKAVDQTDNSGIYSTKAGRSLYKQLTERDISIVPEDQIVVKTVRRPTHSSVVPTQPSTPSNNDQTPLPKTEKKVSIDLPDSTESDTHRASGPSRKSGLPRVIPVNTVAPIQTNDAPTPSWQAAASKTEAEPVTQKKEQKKEVIDAKAPEQQAPMIHIQPTQSLSAPAIRQNIDRLLAGIDKEIDQIPIPTYINNHNKLRNILKTKFDLYRTQLNAYTNPTAEKLSEDFKKLQIMQRTMYAAVRSPKADLEELPFRGINNGRGNCYHISTVQYEIHNQFYRFFITAYGLLGEASLSIDIKIRNSGSIYSDIVCGQIKVTDEEYECINAFKPIKTGVTNKKTTQEEYAKIKNDYDACMIKIAERVQEKQIK
ncbi:hypothetical protein [Endozoicomonas ascidiicola]|uniref:hypothetical protein n=1 Tax=Endozoicomonas ascidiicola TaxID=1698521 RepID=UPI00082CC189|nr:hypothetical protein [Endozoicomonas ascidiicola]